MTMIPFETYKIIQENVPIVCIDGILKNDNGEYLLVKRINEPLKGEYWVPGGRLLKNESLKQAIIRKMQEEIGVAVEIERLYGFFEDFYPEAQSNVKNGLHVISFVFLLSSKYTKDIILDYQSSNFIWSKQLPNLLLERLVFLGEQKL